MKSINQVAQENGDTSANEAARIRERERAVVAAWRTIAFNEGESACTLGRVSRAAELPEEYVAFVCAVKGYALA